MAKSFLAKIKEDIEKTGFITELKIGEQLHSKGWHVSHSESYEDLDTFKSREIDIVATKSYDDSNLNLHIEYHFVIEAKKMTKYPWVIFTTPFVFRGWGWRLLHSGWNYTTKKASIFKPKVLSDNNPLNTKRRFGKAFYEAFKKQNSDENSKIFDAILSVCKAAYYKKINEGAEKPFSTDFNPEESVELHFYLPIIALEGRLIEAYLENGDIALQEESWIPLEYSISSNKFEKSNVTFFPSVVTTDGFEDYIGLVNVWIDSTNKNFSSELKKIKKI